MEMFLVSVLIEGNRTLNGWEWTKCEQDETFNWFGSGYIWDIAY